MIAFMLAAAVTLLPGSSNEWTDGIYTWMGPAECVAAGLLPGPNSPAIDAGELIPGFHCPAPGPDPSGCVEWSGAAPDIGACEYVSGAGVPASPAIATLLGQTGEDVAGTFSEIPDGNPDVHVRLSKVHGEISRVKVSGSDGSLYETPSNGENWIVAVRPQNESLVDLFFNLWRPIDGYNVDITFADGSRQVVPTTAAMAPNAPGGVTLR